MPTPPPLLPGQSVPHDVARPSRALDLLTIWNPGNLRFEQFEPDVVFKSIADVIAGETQLFRNVVAPDLAEGVREQSLQVWTRKTTDGLGTRDELVQRSYDLKPETLVASH